MNQLKKAPGRMFLVAFIASTGLLASAAPGLAAEPTPAAFPLTAPAAAAAPTAPAPGDDPDDEPGGSGGWGGGGGGGGGGGSKDTTKTSETPPETAPRDPEPIDDADDTGRGGSRDPDDRGDSSDQGGDHSYAGAGDPDPSSEHLGTKKQTKAEKAAAQKSAQKAKAAQKKAQKKAAAAKKSSTAKKKAAAKKMKQQAIRASKQAAARAAAQKAAQKRADAQRRATADDSAESPRSGGGVDSLRDAVLDLTNKARKSAGCGTVRYSTQLEKSAQSHANDMSQNHYLSHNDRQGRNSDKRIRSTGFNGDKTGENIAEGFSSPDAVFRAWMNSPSHRRNILDCGFKLLGVGIASSGGYWAQHFGG